VRKVVVLLAFLGVVVAANFEDYLNLIDKLVKRGDYLVAERLLLPFSSENDPRVLYKLATIWFLEGKFSQAELMLASLPKKDAEIYLMLFEIYTFEKNYVKRKEILEKMPNSAEKLYCEAYVEYEKGNYARAIELARRALVWGTSAGVAEGASVEVKAGKVIKNERMKNMGDAYKVSGKLLRKIRKLMAAAYYELGDYESYRSLIEQMARVYKFKANPWLDVMLFPADWRKWMAVGDRFLEKGDVVRALYAYRMAAKLTNNPEVLFGLANLNWRLGNRRKTVIILRKLLNRWPDWDKAIEFAIEVAVSIPDVGWLKEVDTFAKEAGSDLKYLSTAFLDIFYGKYEDAEKELSKARLSALYYFAKGFLAFQRGLYLEALNAFDKAGKKGKYWKALVLTRSGNVEEALKILTENADFTDIMWREAFLRVVEKMPPEIAMEYAKVFGGVVGGDVGGAVKVLGEEEVIGARDMQILSDRSGIGEILVGETVEVGEDSDKFAVFGGVGADKKKRGKNRGKKKNRSGSGNSRVGKKGAGEKGGSVVERKMYREFLDQIEDVAKRGNVEEFEKLKEYLPYSLRKFAEFVWMVDNLPYGKVDMNLAKSEGGIRAVGENGKGQGDGIRRYEGERMDVGDVEAFIKENEVYLAGIDKYWYYKALYYLKVFATEEAEFSILVADKLGLDVGVLEKELQGLSKVNDYVAKVYSEELDGVACIGILKELYSLELGEREDDYRRVIERMGIAFQRAKKTALFKRDRLVVKAFRALKNADLDGAKRYFEEAKKLYGLFKGEKKVFENIK